MYQVGTNKGIFQISCYLCCSVVISVVLCFVCKRVLYYCRRVSTHLQLTNMPYHVLRRSSGMWPYLPKYAACVFPSFCDARTNCSLNAFKISTSGECSLLPPPFAVPFLQYIATAAPIEWVLLTGTALRPWGHVDLYTPEGRCRVLLEIRI